MLQILWLTLLPVRVAAAALCCSTSPNWLEISLQSRSRLVCPKLGRADTIMEVFNILYNYSSEQINNKYRHNDRRSLRKNTNNFLWVPVTQLKRNCTGFTYYGAKIFNNLPNNIRETQDRNIFKTLVKKWIWDEVPSY